jgi:hypothetical protein
MRDAVTLSGIDAASVTAGAEPRRHDGTSARLSPTFNQANSALCGT